jgi:Protein of unknown function (DUF742)
VSVLWESHGIESPAADHDRTLIDGVDESTPGQIGDRHRARHAQPGDDGGSLEPADEWGEPEDFRSVVRPYTWTRGRTRPVQDLAVETLVSTSDEGRDLTSICSAEHAAIVELCAEIRSVAEVAALLTLPLGVARVLLADMIDTGLVHVHSNPGSWENGPDLGLLERVLDGLYRL